jgi:UDP-glucose:glycoprotein glucosyltransferase
VDLLNTLGARVAHVLSVRTMAVNAHDVGKSAASRPDGLDFDAASTLRFPSPVATLRVLVVLDPLSHSAQRMAGLLLALRNRFDLDLTICLDPAKSVAQLPLQRFYRYAPDLTLTFNPDGSRANTGVAAFRDLFTTRLLTMGVDTPAAWLVEATQAVYDLDNLRLADLGLGANSLDVEYTLHALVLSGYAYDVSTHSRPAGLRLRLGNAGALQLTDTVVMENLGYFQLQASPHMWHLSLEPASLTALEIVAGPEEHAQALAHMELSVSSFALPRVMLWLKRKPEHLRTPIDSLYSPTPQTPPSSVESVLSSLSALFGGETSAPVDAADGGGVASEPTINVFSLASGHLYERFLKIMMLSVLKNTKSPVKFWFVENFSSPQFKALVPHFAKEFGCEVEFVTYKWPEWLHRQTEKQRIIWGYKILFLDVLFPLALEKIIYIDADQVRTHAHSLMHALTDTHVKYSHARAHSRRQVHTFFILTNVKNGHYVPCFVLKSF